MNPTPIIPSLDKEASGFYCFQHDTELILVFIDEDGTMYTDLEEVFEVPNGLSCPIDDCTVIIYEITEEDGQ